MDRTRALILSLWFLPTAALGDSMLWMQWQGLGPEAREIALAPGETGLVELYFRTDPDSQHLGRLAFGNQPVPELEQIDTLVLQPFWEDSSVDGPLGNGSQVVDFNRPDCDPAPCPPRLTSAMAPKPCD